MALGWLLVQLVMHAIFQTLPPFSVHIYCHAKTMLLTCLRHEEVVSK